MEPGDFEKLIYGISGLAGAGGVGGWMFAAYRKFSGILSELRLIRAEFKGKFALHDQRLNTLEKRVDQHSSHKRVLASELNGLREKVAGMNAHEHPRRETA